MNQKGFAALLLLLIFLLIIGGVIGGVLYYKQIITPRNSTQIFPSNITSSQKKTEPINKPVLSNTQNPQIEVLTTLPPSDPHILYNTLLDPYSRTAVYIIDKDQYTASSSSTIVVNGEPGKTYSGGGQLAISTDGKRIAYIAKQDDKEFVVVDGIEGKKYDYIKNLKFSPDGQHIAYAAGEGKYFQPDSQVSGNYMVKTMFIVIDNTEGKKYDGTYVGVNVNQTYDPFFSKDGKKVTYTAIKNGKSVLVVDDKEVAEYPSQQYPYPQFIGNTYDLIYLTSENTKNVLMVAGQKKTAHDYISAINNMPYYIGKDASQIAYEATDKNIRTAIINDLSYPIPSGVLQDVTFSNSGKYVAYYTGTWTSKDLYINGKLYGNVQPNGTLAASSSLFSPNEQLLVYSLSNTSDRSMNEQKINLDFISPISLKKIGSISLSGFKGLGPLRFSDDSKYLYFKGWQDRNIVFVTLDVNKLIGN